MQTSAQTLSRPLPVTVLSGFLGAGKTTLLNHLLHAQDTHRIAVIVNDMSEINIDARLVAESGALARTREQLVELSNGCICCTLREDLMREVVRLAEQGRFDYLLIESTGVSEPVPVAQTFTYVDETLGIDLSRVAQLDTLVTVVDAFNFLRDYGSDQLLQDLGLEASEDDRRTLVNLLTDQIEFANVILLNKIDLVSIEERGVLLALLRKLNPSAKIYAIEQGRARPEWVTNTGLFAKMEAEQHEAWQRELALGHHTPETEAYGITSFVFQDPRPFDPQRFWTYLRQHWPATVIRSKGLFWLASRPDSALNWSQAGGSLRAEPAGRWYVSFPLAERMLDENYAQRRAEIEAAFHPMFGDRRNELVLIGQDMDEAQIRQELTDCLLTEAEIAQWHAGTWRAQDPFPAWAAAPVTVGH